VVAEAASAIIEFALIELLSLGAAARPQIHTRLQADGG